VEPGDGRFAPQPKRHGKVVEDLLRYRKLENKKGKGCLKTSKGDMSWIKTV